MSKEKNLSKLYTDEKQDSVDRLKSQAERIDIEYPELSYTAKDIALDVLFFFVSVAGAFGWGMVMLLIISFVTLSYLHFKIKYMIIISVVLAFAVGIYYIVKKIKKYKNYK